MLLLQRELFNQPIVRAWAAALMLAGAAASASAQERSADGEAAGQTVTAHRAVVADASEPLVRVVDLDSGNVLASFRVDAPARLHRGPSGRYVYAAQAEPGRIAAIDTGIAFEDHGDHADIAVTAPRLMRHRLDGPRPSHFNSGGGRLAAFFDGMGLARVVRETDLIEGRLERAARIETGIPHHGVAKPIGALLAVSVPADGERLPVAVELRDESGRALERVACPRLHGEASTARFTAFGCADGIVLYEAPNSRVTGRHIAYPASLPPERMVRSMLGGQSYAVMVGDFGPDGMVVIDPAERSFRFVGLPARRIAFALHAATGDRLFVLLEDGRLAAFNPLDGAPVGTVQATGRYALEGTAPRPRLSTAGAYVVVSNPAAGELVVIDAETLTERRRIALPGAPFDLVAVGGTGTAH